MGEEGVLALHYNRSCEITLCSLPVSSGDSLVVNIPQ